MYIHFIYYICILNYNNYYYNQIHHYSQPSIELPSVFIGVCSGRLVIYINLPPLKAQRILWKVDGKNVRISETSWEVIIYGLDMVLAHNNSQHLHRPLQDQDTPNFSIDGEEVHES